MTRRHMPSTVEEAIRQAVRQVAGPAPPAVDRDVATISAGGGDENAARVASCTAEERRLLDEVDAAMTAAPDLEVERMMALADAERDVVNAAISFIGVPGTYLDLSAVVDRLLTLRAADL